MNFDEFEKDCVSKLNKELFPKITDEFRKLTEQPEFNGPVNKELLANLIGTTISKILEYSSVITMYQIHEYHQWLSQQIDLTTKE